MDRPDGTVQVRISAGRFLPDGEVDPDLAPLYRCMAALRPCSRTMNGLRVGFLVQRMN